MHVPLVCSAMHHVFTRGVVDVLSHDCHTPVLMLDAVYRTDSAARTHFDHIFRSGAKWTMCFALGVLLPTCLC
jgi:hypothetical protein